MTDFGPARDRIIPIPLRGNCTVHLLDLPHDLTEAEAAKLSVILMAFVNPDPCDSGSDRNGEDAKRLSASASQSGPAKTEHRPKEPDA